MKRFKKGIFMLLSAVAVLCLLMPAQLALAGGIICVIRVSTDGNGAATVAIEDQTPVTTSKDEISIEVDASVGSFSAHITVKPADGYIFDKFVDQGGKTISARKDGEAYVISASEDITVKACFKIGTEAAVDVKYFISIFRSAEGGKVGMGRNSDLNFRQPDPPGEDHGGLLEHTLGGLKKGDEFTFTATPEDGYVFAGWYTGKGESGAKFTSDSKITVTAIEPQTTYTAVFKPSGAAAAPTPSPSPSPALTAKPTASTVLVNGGNVAFDAYNIGGNNYFKLRDLAYTLNGTDKQFNVTFNSVENAIELIPHEAYQTAGGEMTGKGAGDKTATPTTSTVYLITGENEAIPMALTAYNIDGNNYFKLRDIGEAFDFGVDWDGAKNTIVIDTRKGYTLD